MNHHQALDFWRAAFLTRSTIPHLGASQAGRYADAALLELRRACQVASEPPPSVPGVDGTLVVGGRAQVLRYEAPAPLGDDDAQPSPLDEGWTGPWTLQHENSVSAFLGVIAICLPGNGVVLSNGLSYPPSCLVALEAG